MVLQGPAGYSNHLWSTGANTPNITVGTTGDYWCEVTYPSGNLVTNGDFSSGNTGFSTEFTYSSTSVNTEGAYTIGTDAATYHPQFSGTGTGNFLIANAGYVSFINGQWDIWCQTISVCPGQTYNLLYKARTLSNAIPARLQWHMDGVATGPESTMPAFNGTPWQTYATLWTAGPTQTSVTACLQVTSGDGIGDDFGLDDISIASLVHLIDTIHVNVIPPPTVDLGPDQPLCTGHSVDLDATVPGATYLWSNGSLLPTLHVNMAGTYSVVVNVNGCANSDQIQFTAVQPPPLDLGNDTTLCAGSILDLDASAAGATNVWQDGSSGPTYQVSTTGLYYVSSSLNGCSSKDSVLVSFTPLPIVSLGNDTSICANAGIILDATVPGAIYLWQDGSTSSHYPVSSTGLYSVTTTVGGCSASDAIHVAVDPMPAVDLGADTLVCPGTAVTFNASTPGAGYLWSTGSTSSTISTSTPGTYAVEVTVTGCSATDTVHLSNFILPSVDLGPDTNFCTGDHISLGLSLAGSSYLWSTGATTDSIMVSAPGIYWVDAGPFGCVERDSISVTQTPLPVFSLGPDLALCPGEQDTLDATLPGANYLWNTGAISPTLIIGPGNWSVAVTVNGCSASDSVEVVSLPSPAVDVGPDTTVCPGTAVTFDASLPSASYLWNTGATTSTLAASTPGPYSVVVTVNGCSASDTAQLLNFSLPSVSLGPDISFCAGEQTQIGLSLAGATYLWNTGETTDSILVSTPGVYWVDAGPFGCAERDSITVTQTPLPVFSLGSDLVRCPGTQDTLDATLPDASYLWNTGAVSPTLVVGPGNWTVAVTVNGCSSSDSVEVASLPTAVVDLGSDTVLCPGASTVLDAFTPGASYTWNDGSFGPTLTASSAGIRSVTVTDSSGCIVTDSIMVDLAVLPILDLGNDTAICTGGQLVLDAAVPGASGYLWSQGSTTDTLSVTAAGAYAVNITIGQCQVQDTIVVTELPLPIVSLGSDTVLCPLTQLTLDPAVPGVGLVWQDGSTGNTFLVNSAGSYSVSATGSNGCESRDSISVGYVDPGNFGLGFDTTLCAGNILYLNTGITGGSTVWTGVVDTLANTLAASTSGTYIAETSFGTCSLSDSITIMFLPQPMLDLGPDQQLCTGSSSQLAPALDNGASLLWDDGSIAPIRTIDQGGTYWAIATLNGCTAGDTLIVIAVPTPTVDLGADTALCGNATLMLDAAIPGASYIWNDGSAVGDRSVGAGLWYVQAESNGCVGTDSINVTSLPLPELDFPADTTLCRMSTWAIDVGQPGASYLWSDGSVAPIFTVDAAGTFGVTVDRAGCVGSAQVAVSYIDLSALDLGSDTLLCPGNSLPLSVNIPGAAVAWQNGSTAPVLTVNAAGTYGVVVSLSGCTAADSIQVSYSSIPTPQLGPDRTLCSGDSLTLQVSAGSALVQWSTGEVGPSITVHTAGAYTVILLQDGCTSSDHMQVDLIQTIDEVDLGPDREVCPGYPLTLDATIPGAAYAWNNGSHSAVLTTDQPGIYIVHAQGQCILAADTVVLTDINCEPRIYVPNAFTPNDDDINDRFAPSMDEQVLSWTLRIFDRWGSMVHTSTPDNAGWDGTISSGPAPPGVYVWVLEYKTCEGGRTVDRTERGSVVLLR